MGVAVGHQVPRASVSKSARNTSFYAARLQDIAQQSTDCLAGWDRLT
jgi:hypothetical protein